MVVHAEEKLAVTDIEVDNGTTSLRSGLADEISDNKLRVIPKDDAQIL